MTSWSSHDWNDPKKTGRSPALSLTAYPTTAPFFSSKVRVAKNTDLLWQAAAKKYSRSALHGEKSTRSVSLTVAGESNIQRAANRPPAALRPPL